MVDMLRRHVMSDTTASRGGAVLVSAGVATVALVLLGAGVSLRLLGDFDLPLHVAMGRLVWATRHVPRVDDFSYLHGPVRYTEVASVTLFWWAYRAGGALGLQMVGGLSAAALAFALWLQTRRFGPAALVAATLAVTGAASFLVVRSSALSFPLLAFVLLALDVHRRAPATRPGRQGLAAFVALSFLWANTHGSVPFGLVVGAGYVAYRAACRLARGRLGALLPAADAADLPAAAVALALAVGAASVNTAGPQLLLGPLRFGGLHRLASFTEWARPTWSFYREHEPLAALVLVVAIGCMALGRDADTGARTPALFEVGLLAIAVACAVTAVRLVPLGLVLIAPVIARRTSHALRSAPAPGAVLLACAAGTLLAPASVLASSLPLGIGFDTSHLPEGAARWAEAHHPTGRLWNSPSFGGYLVFRLYPDVRVLMDGRHGDTAYDPADAEAVDASETDPAVFASLSRQHDLQWAVTRALEGAIDGQPIAASRDWAMVFLDDVASVYVRIDGPDGRFAQEGYRVLRHTTPPSAALALAEHPGEAAEALAHDGALAVSQAPGSARAAFLWACGAVAARDAAHFGEARAHLASMARSGPALAALDAAWERVLGGSSGNAAP
jgi:hypothetical protein